MKRTARKTKNRLYVEITEGEQLIDKIRRMTENKEPITDGAPLIYTEKKDGVIAGYDIRTDKWAVALEAMDKVNNQRILQSAQYMNKEEPKEEPKAEPKAEPKGDNG